jgi:HK97 family phage prohead protease
VADHFRSFRPELEVRSKGDGRTIVGIAVPWGVPQYISPGLTEQFRSGAFNEHLGPVQAGGTLRGANKVYVAREHIVLGGELLGRATLLRNDTAGLYAELRVSKTERGDETLELVRDEALTDLSIMFREGANARLPGGITERVTANLVEIAIVLEGAYGDAALVQAVRAQGSPYQPPSTPDTPRLDEARRLLADLPTLPGQRQT